MEFSFSYAHKSLAGESREHLLFGSADPGRCSTNLVAVPRRYKCLDGERVLRIDCFHSVCLVRHNEIGFVVRSLLRLTVSPAIHIRGCTLGSVYSSHIDLVLGSGVRKPLKTFLWRCTCWLLCRADHENHVEDAVD